MLSDTEANVVVTSDKLFQLFEGLEVQKIVIDQRVKEADEAYLELPEVNSEDLAYVIYTSGSTGKTQRSAYKHMVISSVPREGVLVFYDEKPKFISSSFLNSF